MQNPIFKIKNLIYKKKNSNILNIKSFEIHRGSCYIINGNMASGKTLLLNIISNNNKKYKGQIYYDNKLLSSYSKSVINKEIKYVQQVSYPPYFKTVNQYLEGSLNNNLNKVDKLKNINNIVGKMDFKYLSKIKMRDLTPSQYRWVDLAGKIISYPKVLIIDELELHLSINNVKTLSKILYRKCNYEGVTIIATTQNKDIFNNLATINININHGRITSVRSNSKKKFHK